MIGKNVISLRYQKQRITNNNHLITEKKVMELIVDDSCKSFDAMMAKYTLKSVMKCPYHHASTISKSKVIFIALSPSHRQIPATSDIIQSDSKNEDFPFPLPTLSLSLQKNDASCVTNAIMLRNTYKRRTKSKHTYYENKSIGTGHPCHDILHDVMQCHQKHDRKHDQ